MPPKKLSDSEKIDIIALYKETAGTTSTLAERYNVSNSTISRLLKSRLPTYEYEMLVQQKRAAAGKGQAHQSRSNPPSQEEVTEQSPESTAAPSSELQSDSGSLTEISEASPGESDGTPQEETAVGEIPLEVNSTAKPSEEVAVTVEEIDDDTYLAQASTLKELLGEDLFPEDQDDDLDSDDLEDASESSGDRLFPKQPINLASKTSGKSHLLIQVLPLSEASVPQICYVVIDRAAELITRPLKEFSELGQIPPSETGERTLPIFDNHRVARRFSKRSHKVIKVPDGKVLQKVGTYLLAKGITRLLIDGQVYSL